MMIQGIDCYVDNGYLSLCINYEYYSIYSNRTFNCIIQIKTHGNNIMLIISVAQVAALLSLVDYFSGYSYSYMPSSTYMHLLMIYSQALLYS